LLTTAQAAERLGVNRQWIWRLVQAGRLPAIRYGRDWLIAEADLAQLPPRKVGRPPRPSR
jgi:excisionase family DNA binding protein